MSPNPLPGYTLPVFAVAAAKAALINLQSYLDSYLDNNLDNSFENTVEKISSISLDLLDGNAEIPVEQAAVLDDDAALGITLSNPGDNLDLTKNTPVWALVKLFPRQNQIHKQILTLEAGEGLGKTAKGEAAIYSFARRLFDANLLPLIPEDKTVTVKIILPQGRELAKRTSNEAFGILEGLALLGTSGISQPLSAAEHLEEFRGILREKVKTHRNLVFCIGANGYSVAERLSIPESAIVPTGNWLGALLVEAGLYKAESVLLLGYQGKLVKLAGGIFNTSSHIADAKLEIIAAAVVEVGGDIEAIRAVLEVKTADAAHKKLIELGLADAVFKHLAEKISRKAESYVKKYADVDMKVGVVLFGRKGEVIYEGMGNRE